MKKLLSVAGLLIATLPLVTACSFLPSNQPQAATTVTVTAAPPSSPAAPETTETPTTDISVEAPTGTTAPAPESTAPAPPATTAPPATQTKAANGPPASLGEANARIEAAVSAGRTKKGDTFLSAGGGIYCQIDNEFVGCELTNGKRIKDPNACREAAANGGPNGVGRVESSSGRSTAVCNSDTIVTEDTSAMARVPVGTVVIGAGARCISETDGVTCVAGNHGWYLGPNGYRIF